MIPKFPIHVTFDPANSESLKELWAIPAGRILLLLWKPCHLCSDRWPETAVEIVKRIEATKPQTPEELFKCFLPNIMSGVDFSKADVTEFCVEAIRFFNNSQQVEYCLVGPTMKV